MASSTSTIVMATTSDNIKKEHMKQLDDTEHLEKKEDESIEHQKHLKKTVKHNIIMDAIANMTPEHLLEYMTLEQKNKCYSLVHKQINDNYLMQIPKEKIVPITLEQRETSCEVDKCVIPILNNIVIKANETTKGNTQKGERVIIGYVRDSLVAGGFIFTEASSQQPLDFRNVRKKDKDEKYGINIEIKRTKGTTIFCNDTIPAYNTKFLICYTGNKGPRVINCTGSELMGENIKSIDNDWEKRIRDIHIEHRGILNMRQTYKNIEFIKDSPMRIFPRINLSVKIHHLLN